MKFHCFYLCVIAVALSGCATPKEINGKKVVATRWVDGRVVYILEGDKEAMKRAAEEAREAAKGLVFKPEK